jgi:hypothetical protein
VRETKFAADCPAAVLFDHEAETLKLQIKIQHRAKAMSVDGNAASSEIESTSSEPGVTGRRYAVLWRSFPPPRPPAPRRTRRRDSAGASGVLRLLDPLR